MLVPQFNQILCQAINPVHAWHTSVIHSLQYKTRQKNQMKATESEDSKVGYSDFIFLHFIIYLHTPDWSGDAES